MTQEVNQLSTSGYKAWTLPSIKHREKGWVYFVGGDCPHVKIGWTGDLRRRLVDLQCGSPVRLFLLAKLAGPSQMEKDVQFLFKGDWSHGEWYRKTPELNSLINDLAAADSHERVSRGLTA